MPKLAMSRAGSLLLGALWALGACAGPPEPGPDPHDLPLLGTKPFAPLPKVSFTMPDMWGDPFDFRAETDGRIALLFFGYTYCPDVCPLQMATLAAALKQTPEDVRSLVHLVFVTVDPERDTPERLRQWLSAFDTTFVGVRGTADQIAEALAFYRYPAPERGPEETGYLVGHPALVYAFTPDDLGRAMYGAETREATWLHDLTLMAGADWTTVDRATTAPANAASPGVLGSAGAVLVLDATVAEPAAGSTAALYLTLLNTGTEADTLVGVSAEAAIAVSLHETRVEGGLSTMHPVAGVTLPPGTTVRMRPGGIHAMLEGLDPVPQAGGTVRVTVEVRAGGRVTVPARVVPYSEVGRRTDPRH